MKNTLPVRILNLFTIMNRGGAESMVMNYYRKMDRSKIQFDFLVHREERGAFDEEIESMGGKIFRICPLNPLKFGEYKKQIAKFFDIHTEYKIIHSHMSESGYFAFKEAIKHDIPIRICHAHNTPNYSGWMINDRIKGICRYYFKNRIRSLTTDMFTCSNDAGKWLFGYENASRLIMMNNAVDAGSLKYSDEVSQIVKQELGINGKYVIGHTGRFNVQKNHKFLIEIFRKYSEINKDAVLLLAGDGELKSEIKKAVADYKIEDKVIFLGVRSDMERIYQAFDIFLFPSLFEGLSVALIEAQAAGIPCVVSENISPQTIITDIVEKLPIDKGVSCWIEKLKEKETAERYDNYESVVEAKFDIESNVKWLTDYYLKALKY